jgi:outer membrane usher protein
VGTISLNYTARIGEKTALTLTSTRLTGPSPGTAVGVSLIVPLDNQMSIAASVTSRAGQSDGHVSASKPATAETGVGWRALAGRRTQETYSEGGVYFQGNRGTLSADVSASSSQSTVRLGAQGGLVLVDGKMFASRRVQDSFALVEVPGYANVGVGFQGNTLTRTDKDGFALLPRLLPYQRNSVRLDASELPINAELDTIEQIAVPAARSGVKVLFPVRSGRGALIRLVLEDGEPAPAGAEIELIGDKQEFFVARRGEAFITGLQTDNRIRLRWKDKACTITLTLPPGSPDEITRVGPLICQGVPR